MSGRDHVDIREVAALAHELAAAFTPILDKLKPDWKKDVVTGPVDPREVFALLHEIAAASKPILEMIERYEAEKARNERIALIEAQKKE